MSVPFHPVAFKSGDSTAITASMNIGDTAEFYIGVINYRIYAPTHYDVVGNGAVDLETWISGYNIP